MSLALPVPVGSTTYDPCPGSQFEVALKATSLLGSYPRELVAGLQSAAHERAHERVSGADTYRTVGRAAHLEQSALPTRSVRMVAHEREHILRWTVDGDALLDCDHRKPPLRYWKPASVYH